MVRRTGFGRHVFAVGGNAEAARRAGISVNRVRVAVSAAVKFMVTGGVLLLAVIVDALARQQRSASGRV